MECLFPPRLARTFLASVACTVMLSACSISNGTSSDSPDSEDTLIRTNDASNDTLGKDSGSTTMEAVQTIKLSGSAVQASVVSSGCTAADDFHIEHEMVGDACIATLVRDKPDLCRRAPYVTQLVFEWQPPQNCAVLDISFANPVVNLEAQLASKSLILKPRSE